MGEVSLLLFLPDGMTIKSFAALKWILFWIQDFYWQVFMLCAIPAFTSAKVLDI